MKLKKKERKKMGTRSLTTFKEDHNNEEIVVLYRQFDGYPEGHGIDLFRFLNKMNMVNGIAGGEKRKISNGMSCLAAQMVSYFKDEPGSFYLYRADTRDVGEEYIYTIYVNHDIDNNEREIMIKVEKTSYDESFENRFMEKIFDGPTDNYKEWLESLVGKGNCTTT
jgi:hypothetical protein